uniref:Chromosomal replication initiator protein n=1 Tax=Steinernema glaseri TaxID=37863 RepID=A0A1I8AHM8_9BILA
GGLTGGVLGGDELVEERREEHADAVEEGDVGEGEVAVLARDHLRGLEEAAGVEAEDAGGGDEDDEAERLLRGRVQEGEHDEEDAHAAHGERVVHAELEVVAEEADLVRGLPGDDLDEEHDDGRDGGGDAGLLDGQEEHLVDVGGHELEGELRAHEVAEGGHQDGPDGRVAVHGRHGHLLGHLGLAGPAVDGALAEHHLHQLAALHQRVLVRRVAVVEHEEREEDDGDDAVEVVDGRPAEAGGAQLAGDGHGEDGRHLQERGEDGDEDAVLLQRGPVRRDAAHDGQAGREGGALHHTHRQDVGEAHVGAQRHQERGQRGDEAQRAEDAPRAELVQHDGEGEHRQQRAHGHRHEEGALLRTGVVQVGPVVAEALALALGEVLGPRARHADDREVEREDVAQDGAQAQRRDDHDREADLK